MQWKNGRKKDYQNFRWYCSTKEADKKIDQAGAIQASFLKDVQVAKRRQQG